MDRRSFFLTAGGFAVAGLATRQAQSGERAQPGGTARVAVFRDPKIPVVDACVDDATLNDALSYYSVTRLDASQIRSSLVNGGFDLLVMAHGSVFPKDCIDAFQAYIAHGGNWLQLGGVPFGSPAVFEGGTWRVEAPQTQFHKRLGITQTQQVHVADMKAVAVNVGDERLAESVHADKVYELSWILTDSKSYPDEDGSDGPRIAVIKPLVTHGGQDDPPAAASVAVVDRLAGAGAGGRWVLAALSGSIDADGLRLLAAHALGGAMDLRAVPSFAAYRTGERARIIISLNACRSVASAEITLTLFDAVGKELSLQKVKINMPAAGPALKPQTREVVLTGGTAAPGFYRAACVGLVRMRSGASHVLRCETGFWRYNAVLMKSGAPLVASGDLLSRGGAPYPVAGVTYMSGDAHRRFLLEPNPAVWMRDMAAMKAAGANMVRTGIWTGWRAHMSRDGSVREEVLRAFEAFVHCCRAHDMPLIFTFFAFLPEDYGGANVYFDARALDGQKRFVRSFTERVRDVKDLAWDFINEPSFCSPGHLWSCRPNGDKYELAAWNAWLEKRYPAGSARERRLRLMEVWHARIEDVDTLPAQDDFADVNINGHRLPFKTLDYRLFAQESFARWVRVMRGAVREHGAAGQLVTVGQDEGGTVDRPSPQFFSDEVDFTSIHNWWFNDDLVWDNVMTGVAGVPHLVEETGVMYYEHEDGHPVRSEQEIADLLERKLAIALAANGAGSIHWLWNTNVCMLSENEAAIGLLRADGSAKPEFRTWRRMARFIAGCATHMHGIRTDDVIMVIPHSRMFMPRNSAIESTRRCVRAMWYDCHVPMSAVSEYHLERVVKAPKLLVLPSAQALTDEAWSHMVHLARSGSVVLVTGPVVHDAYGRVTDRFSALGLPGGTAPVSQVERLEMDTGIMRMVFRGEKQQRVLKSAHGKAVCKLQWVPLEKGGILWSPVPVELSDVMENTVTLYKAALARAGVKPAFTVAPDSGDILVSRRSYDDAILYICVSEESVDREISIADSVITGTYTLRIPAGRVAMLMIGKNGTVLTKYNDE
jgi:hypothetical protein